eukprot:m.1226699 g.1226699  ORF g.1226699 m.1226699 type:complete len:1645 (+) comp24638_c0_seq2:142-5076(+)
MSTTSAVVLVLCSLAATSQGQTGSYQSELDLYCHTIQSSYIARYIPLDANPGSLKQWRCIQRSTGLGNEGWDATATAATCTGDAGTCTDCAGTVVDNRLDILSDANLVNYVSSNGLSGLFSGAGGTNITDDLLTRLRQLAGRTWLCPAEMSLDWSPATATTTTIKQFTTITWSWTGLRNVRSGTFSAPTSDFTSGAIANGGTFSYTFNLIGSFQYFSSTSPSESFTIVVQDANECIGEGQVSCSTSDETCFNTEGSYYCLDTCATAGVTPCSVTGQVCTAGIEGVAGNACFCTPGYMGEDACSDVNECELGSDTCDDPQHTCTNTDGSFVCECNDGYTVDGATCADVDECATDTSCATEAACANTVGSYTCACNDGFSGSGLTCDNIDECLRDPSPCAQTCSDSVGSFACSCGTGYTLNSDNSTCDDVDECVPLGEYCGDNAVCTNAIGNASCVCVAGFAGDAPTTPCTNVDECTADTHTCAAAATCTDTVGSFNCTCNEGYEGTGTVCSNIDECVEGTDDCGPYNSCVDTVGSFSCEPINECTADLHDCSSNAACTDIAEGFTCACNLGYTGNGTTCDDVDECVVSAPCSDNCTNSDGGYACSCSGGRELLGDLQTCVDINECTRETDDCAPNARCTDVAGSFTCACNVGYTGSGTTCIDIDECATGHTCDANAECTDTDGSFTCACNAGYSGGGTTCEDIDECASAGLNNCGANTACNNTLGAFTCSCLDGFGQSTDDLAVAPGTFQCTGFTGCASNPCQNEGLCVSGGSAGFLCVCNGTGFAGEYCADPFNECEDPAANDCDVHAECNDIAGSFTCECLPGWVGSGTTCSNRDECVLSIDDCDENAFCTDTAGSFTCACDSSAYSGSGTECSLRTVGYEIRLAPGNDFQSFVGSPVRLHIVAVDHLNNILTTENNDVMLTVNSDLLYKPLSVAPQHVDIVAGQAFVEFSGDVPGIYVLGLDLIDNSSSLATQQGFQVWFATNSSYNAAPAVGMAVVTTEYSFTNIARHLITSEWVRSFAAQLATGVLPNDYYVGTPRPLPSYTAPYPPLETGSVFVVAQPAARKFSVSVGLKFASTGSGTPVGYTTSFYAHLHSTACSVGNGGSPQLNPQRVSSDPANAVDVQIKCSANGECVGHANIRWIPDDSFDDLSIVVFDSPDRAAQTPRFLCANLATTVKTDFFDLKSLQVGGTSYSYLGSDLSAPVRMRRQTATYTLTAAFSINTPEALAPTAAEALASPAGTALVATLQESALVSSAMVGTTSTVLAVPQVLRRGVDCSADVWTPFSECSTACVETAGSVVSGVRLRTRQCPVQLATGVYSRTEVEPCVATETCDAPPSCAVDNGGCHANALCSDSTGVVSCTCNFGYIGSGTVCLRSETDTTGVTFTYNLPIVSVAPLQSDRLLLVKAITDKVGAVAGFNNARVANPRLSVGGNWFTVTFTVAPLTVASPTPACTVATTIGASAKNSFVIVFSGVALTPGSKVAVCPEPMPTFTTTTQTSTTTATETDTTITQTSVTTTFFNASNAGSADANEAEENKWGSSESIFLIGSLLVVFTILMVVGLVCAVRQNSKRKFLELGLVMNPGGETLHGQDGTVLPSAMKPESGPGEEHKWLASDGTSGLDSTRKSAHFYPPPGMSSPNP